MQVKFEEAFFFFKFCFFRFLLFKFYMLRDYGSICRVLLYMVATCGAFRCECVIHTKYKRNVRLFNVSPPSHSSPPRPPQRKKKANNKYSQYSKTDQLAQDPWDQQFLIQQQQIKDETKDSQQSSSAPSSMEFPQTNLIDPVDPTTFGFVPLGMISAAHGVHGHVRIIKAETDFGIHRLCTPSIGAIGLRPQGRKFPRFVGVIEGRQVMGKEKNADFDYLVKFKDINDRNAASRLRGCEVFGWINTTTPTSTSTSTSTPTPTPTPTLTPPTLPPDEFLVRDLVGCNIHLVGNKQDNKLGTISSIILKEHALAHDNLEIKLCNAGIVDEFKFALIPFVPTIVPTVDLKSKLVYIDPPSGLLESCTFVRREKVVIRGLLPGTPARPPA